MSFHSDRGDRPGASHRELANLAGSHLNGLISALLELRVDYPGDFRIALARTIVTLLRLSR